MCSNSTQLKWIGIKFGRGTFNSAATAAAAKSLQSCPTLCDPIDGSPLGSAVLGFSRQEHWSGLLFSSPMQESEKWKWSRSVMSVSLRPHGLQPTRFLRPWDFPGKRTGVGLPLPSPFNSETLLNIRMMLHLNSTCWKLTSNRWQLLNSFLKWETTLSL